MKILITYILLLISTLCYSQNNIVNNTEFNLDKFSIEICKELNIDNTSIIIEQTRGLIFGKYYAVSFGQNKSYIIRISDILKYQESKDALIHELVHISQLSTNKLVIIDHRTIGFNGSLYQVSEETHYNDVQEKEARIIAETITKIMNKNGYKW